MQVHMRVCVYVCMCMFLSVQTGMHVRTKQGGTPEAAPGCARTYIRIQIGPIHAYIHMYVRTGGIPEAAHGAVRGRMQEDSVSGAVESQGPLSAWVLPTRLWRY